MTTDKQMEANRANAQKSTGPTTQEGKAKVGQNAVTHGLLARNSIISGGPGREDAGEFTAQLDGHREYWQPVGQYEETLVETMAVACWNQYRVAAFETGAIRRIRDNVESQLRDDLLFEMEDDLEVLHRKGDPWQTGSAGSYSRPLYADSAHVTRTKIRRRLRKNPFSVRHLIDTVTQTTEEIERTGKLGADQQRRLENEFLSGEQCLAAQMFYVLERTSSKFSAKDQTTMLELLREEQAGLEDLLVIADERQQEIVEAAVLEASIPSMADIERSRRYGSTYERKFNQAVLQLERAQHRRKEDERLRAKEVQATQAAAPRPVDFESPAPDPDEGDDRKDDRNGHHDRGALQSIFESSAGDSPGTGTRGGESSALRENPAGVRHLMDTIDGAINELITTNELSEPRLTELELDFSEPDSSLFVRIDELGKRINGQCTFPRPSLGIVRSLLQHEKEELEALLKCITGSSEEIEE